MQRFQAFVGNLEEDDRKAIFRWLGDVRDRDEEEILDQLPPRDRDNIRDIPDPEARQKTLGFVMAMQRQNPKMPAPNLEDFNRLMDSLSSNTVAQIEQARHGAARSHPRNGRGRDLQPPQSAGERRRPPQVL